MLIGHALRLKKNKQVAPTELNTLIRMKCYKQDALTGLKKSKQPCSGNCCWFHPKGIKFNTLRLHYQTKCCGKPVGSSCNLEPIISAFALKAFFLSSFLLNSYCSQPCCVVIEDFKNAVQTVCNILEHYLSLQPAL